MTQFDPKVYRNSKDGIGGPGDDKATDATSNWTLVALMKGLYYLLATTGITINGITGGATSAKQDTGNTTLAAIDGHVDGIETLIGTTNTTLSTIDGHVDGLETLVTSTNTKLDTLHTDIATTQAGLVGALTETAPITDTASSGLNGRLQRIAQRITSLIALVPASLGAKTAAASFAVTLATDDAIIGGTADAAATAGSTGSLSAKLRAISRDLIANIVLAAGTNLIGRTVADASAATGGIATTARLASAAASTNGTLVKGSAGRVYQVSGKNNAAYDVFLVLYDAVTNPPVPGTTTIRKKIVCPAGQAFVYDWPLGLSFATGIGYAFTKLVADADTTVLVAADITAFNVDYV